MTYRISPKAGFVIMTSVAALLTMGLPAHQANAACTEVMLGMGRVTTTCTMTTGTGYAESVLANQTWVNVEAGAVVNNSMAGTIGILVGTSGKDTVTNSGTINGADLGVGMSGGNNNLLSNFLGGTISATKVAVSINNGQNASLANAGTITGGTGAGVYVNAASGVIINNIVFGTIRSTSGAGVHFDSVATESNTLKSVKEISGGGVAVGVLGGAGNETVENAGTITGGAGTAIDLGAGDNTLLNGGNIAGSVVMGGGNDKIHNLNLAIIERTVNMGAGNDQLTNTGIGSVIAGNVDMGTGDDTVTNSGTIRGSIALGDGVNALHNADGNIQGSITAGADNDTVINSGFMGGNIDLGDGDDRLTLIMGFDMMGRSLMRVSGTIDGGLGNDRLSLEGGMAGETQTFNNTVSNVELLNKRGAGRWVLDNGYNFGIGVVVDAGELNIAAGQTVVAGRGFEVAGGTFSGLGRVQGNVNVSGGTLHPGDGATGTLTVTGNVTVGVGSFVEVSVGPGTAQTKLAVSGNLSLAGRGTLTVTIAPGFYKANASYDVITGGAVNGQFGSVSLPAGTRFTQFKVDYAKANTVRVLVEKLGYEIIAETYNQRQAAGGLTRGLAGAGAGSDMENVIAAFERLGTDEAMREALDSLSGEAWAAMGEVRGGVTRNFRALGMGRIGGNLEGVGVWGNVLQGQEDVKGDGNGERINGDVGGLVGGVEYGFGGGKVGVMVGYGQGDLKLRSRGEGEVKLMMGGVYGGWSFGGIEVSGGVSYASGKQKVERHIGVGTVQRDVRGSEKVREYGANVGVGYGINLGMIRVTPEVGLEMARVEEKGFEENGGGAVSLSGEREKGWEGRGHVRVEVSAVFQAGVVSFEPYVKGGYERVLVGKGYQDREVSFQQPGTAFNVRSTDGSKNIYTGGGGLNVGFGPVTVGVGYQQSIGGKRDERTFKGSLGIRW